MKTSEIIRACNTIVHSNRGIALTEEIKLKSIPRVKISDHSDLNPIELVSLARKVVYKTLGRTNVTPRDIKKAIINIFDYE